MKTIMTVGHLCIFLLIFILSSCANQSENVAELPTAPQCNEINNFEDFSYWPETIVWQKGAHTLIEFENPQRQLGCPVKAVSMYGLQHNDDSYRVIGYGYEVDQYAYIFWSDDGYRKHTFTQDELYEYLKRYFN